VIIVIILLLLLIFYLKIGFLASIPADMVSGLIAYLDSGAQYAKKYRSILKLEKLIVFE